MGRGVLLCNRPAVEILVAPAAVTLGMLDAVRKELALATVEPSGSVLDQCAEAMLRVLGKNPFGSEPVREDDEFCVFMDTNADSQAKLRPADGFVLLVLSLFGETTCKKWPNNVAVRNSKALAVKLQTVYQAEQSAYAAAIQAVETIRELVRDHDLVGGYLRGPKVKVTFDCR